MSRDRIRRYLITYDVPSDRRRTKISHELESYGDRLQYSVFVVDAHPASMTRLKTELLDLMNPSEDSVLVCDLGLKINVADHNFQYLGQQRTMTDETALIV